LPETSLSARQARRIALAAQGFSGPRPERACGRARLDSLARRLGVIQIDSVNVLVRSHYLPLFSRLGAYDRAHLEAAAWGRRPSLFEYWGHEASLLPLHLQPLFRWRMERARAGETWSGLARFAREHRGFIDTVLRRIESEGPVTGGDFAVEPRQAGWWNWSNGKKALEWLFWAGFITTRTRRGFERVYDLTERVLPSAVLATPTPEPVEAQRQLLRISASALGVATAGDLRDYYRLPAQGMAERIAELVDDGQLIPVTVEGWRQGAFLAPGQAAARPIRGAALLSPFDNLIWRRERAERLFGARIKLEIYTPAARREHGYYVLPLLVNETIAARVDLKADRAAGTLRVQAAHVEPGAPIAETAAALASELQRAAAWLGLERVAPVASGSLSAALIAHLT
jgi:uncharacterized protein YcaQ